MTQTKQIPRSLLRFFCEEEHASCFLDGRLRFGLLDKYRAIEGSRGDPTEGLVSFEWNTKAPELLLDRKRGELVGQRQSSKNIHYKSVSLNPYYILCTSDPGVNIPDLKRKFGRFVVRINDPATLLERIKTAWRVHAWALDGCAFIAPVVYDKDELLEANPGLIAPPQYSYSQKPKRVGDLSYEEDREFRYVLQCSVDPDRIIDEFLTLSVLNCRDICCPE